MEYMYDKKKDRVQCSMITTANFDSQLFDPLEISYLQYTTVS